jgi:hypothetical protein
MFSGAAAAACCLSPVCPLHSGQGGISHAEAIVGPARIPLANVELSGGAFGKSLELIDDERILPPGAPVIDEPAVRRALFARAAGLSPQPLITWGFPSKTPMVAAYISVLVT